MFENIEITLTVNAWNIVISSLSVLSFDESKEILKEIAEQTKGIEAKGEDPVMISLSPTHINQILGVVQLLPYHVSNGVVTELYNQSMTTLAERQEKTDGEKTDGEGETKSETNDTEKTE